MNLFVFFKLFCLFSFAFMFEELYKYVFEKTVSHIFQFESTVMLAKIGQFYKVPLQAGTNSKVTYV